MSCIITQHIQGRLYFHIYLNIILLFGFSNELGTWDVQIVIIVIKALLLGIILEISETLCLRHHRQGISHRPVPKLA